MSEKANYLDLVLPPPSIGIWIAIDIFYCFLFIRSLVFYRINPNLWCECDSERKRFPNFVMEREGYSIQHTKHHNLCNMDVWARYVWAQRHLKENPWVQLSRNNRTDKRDGTWRCWKCVSQNTSDGYRWKSYKYNNLHTRHNIWYFCNILHTVFEFFVL